MQRLARTMTIACALAAVACGAGAGGAGGGAVETGILRSGAVDLWVVSDDEPLPVYNVDGRHYLLGERGRGYSIVVANRAAGRIETVISVDGRDVVSGRRADFRRDRGYVLEPGEELRIDGFRRSLDQVAAFEFAPPGDAYAARMGDGASIGVIGLAAFEEDDRPSRPVPIAGDDDRDDPRPRDEVRRGEPSMPAPPAAGAVSHRSAVEAAVTDGPGLGTRYGRDLGSEAEVVPFRRKDAEQPLELLALYYDDRRGLERRGVVFPEPPPPDICAGPNPFPGVPCDDRFAAPPPGH